MPEYIRIKQRFRLKRTLTDQRDDLTDAIKELVPLVKKMLPTTVWCYYPKKGLDETQLKRLGELFAIMNVASLRKPIQEICDLDNAGHFPEDQYWWPPYAVESVDVVCANETTFDPAMLCDSKDLLLDMEHLAEECAALFGGEEWYKRAVYDKLLHGDEYQIAAKIALGWDCGKVYPLLEHAKMPDELRGPKRKAGKEEHAEAPKAKRAKAEEAEAEEEAK